MANLCSGALDFQTELALSAILLWTVTPCQVHVIVEQLIILSNATYASAYTNQSWMWKCDICVIRNETRKKLPKNKIKYYTQTMPTNNLPLLPYMERVTAQFCYLCRIWNIFRWIFITIFHDYCQHFNDTTFVEWFYQRRKCEHCATCAMINFNVGFL